MSSECQKPVTWSTSVCCHCSAEPNAMSGAAPWSADMTERRGDRSASRRDLLLWALALGFVIFIACSSALVVSCLSGMERRLEEKIERTILKMLTEEKQGQDTLNVKTVYKELVSNTIDAQFHSVKKRQAKSKQPKSGKVTKKPKTYQKLQPDFIHLEGRDTDPPLYEKERNNAFIWGDTAHRIQTHMEGLLSKQYGGVVQIKIKTKGVYLVYSQVAASGQNQHRPSERFDCSHQTVLDKLDKPPKESRVLLRSLVTQHNYGERFLGDPNEIDPSYADPLDTKLQMGVFILEPGDLISVRYLEKCDHYKYSLSKNHTYFGVVTLKLLEK